MPDAVIDPVNPELVPLRAAARPADRTPEEASDGAADLSPAKLLHALRRRWLIAVPLATLAAAAAGYAGSHFVRPVSTVRAMVHLSAERPAAVYENSTEGRPDFAHLQRSQVLVLKSRAVLQAAVRNLEPAGLAVLFGTHNLSATEGAPKVIRDVAASLHARGAVRASLFAPAPGAAPAGLDVFADEQTFGRRFIDGRWTPTEYAAAQRHLRQVFRTLRPGAVVANTAGLFPLVEAAIRAGVPSVLCVQETYLPPLRAALFSPYARGRLEWAMRHAGRVLFASHDCRDAYADLGLGNAVVVPNGLDVAPLDTFMRRAAKADTATFRVVCVGTVCERKAQHVLVEAAALVPGLEVQLVGCREGLPYLGYVRALAAARGVSDRIDFVPETPDVWPYLRAADAFVCCSHVEAYSLSVLEGLAFGLPVVSTPCGGLNEQVAWGVNALRFDFDDHHTLAAHLGRLMADGPLRADMSREARAGFDLLPTAANVVDRYAGVIAAAVREMQC